MPDSAGGASGGGNDPEGAFDKSLGDFDGDIARERDAMASAGKGSGRGAETRETGDADAVKKSAGRAGGAGAATGGVAASGGTGGAEGGLDGSGPSVPAAPPGSTEDGSGKTKSDGSSGPKDATGSQGKGPVAAIPDDIPRDGTGESEVAKQIREAAEAEEDPRVREALWEEYRRVTGISR